MSEKAVTKWVVQLRKLFIVNVFTLVLISCSVSQQKLEKTTQTYVGGQLWKVLLANENHTQAKFEKSELADARRYSWSYQDCLFHVFTKKSDNTVTKIEYFGSACAYWLQGMVRNKN